jgi:hypothetical protein
VKLAQSNRREVLLGGAMALVAGALPVARADAEATARSQSADDAVPGDRSGAPWVVLHDPRVPATVAMQGLQARPAMRLALDADPVRMWRGAHASLLANPRTTLAGTTTWPQFLIVRGLAEESGRRVRRQHFDAASGTVRWLIC